MYYTTLRYDPTLNQTPVYKELKSNVGQLLCCFEKPGAVCAHVTWGNSWAICSRSLWIWAFPFVRHLPCDPCG